MSQASFSVNIPTKNGFFPYIRCEKSAKFGLTFFFFTIFADCRFEEKVKRHLIHDMNEIQNT